MDISEDIILLFYHFFQMYLGKDMLILKQVSDNNYSEWSTLVLINTTEFCMYGGTS